MNKEFSDKALEIIVKRCKSMDRLQRYIEKKVTIIGGDSNNKVEAKQGYLENVVPFSYVDIYYQQKGTSSCREGSSMPFISEDVSQSAIYTILDEQNRILFENVKVANFLKTGINDKHHDLLMRRGFGIEIERDEHTLIRGYHFLPQVREALGGIERLADPATKKDAQESYIPVFVVLACKVYNEDRNKKH